MHNITPETVEPKPVISTTSLLPLDPSVVRVWSIKTALGLAVLFVGSLIFDLVSFTRGSAELPFVVSGSILLLSIIFSFAIPRLKYRFWKYELREQELFLQRGIFNRVSTIVPLRRIQHLDVSQDIIEKEFGLAKLIVHTAGTRSSDVVLPGLQKDIAEGLRDTVKDFILEDTL